MSEDDKIAALVITYNQLVIYDITDIKILRYKLSCTANPFSI